MWRLIAGVQRTLSRRGMSIGAAGRFGCVIGQFGLRQATVVNILAGPSTPTRGEGTDRVDDRADRMAPAETRAVISSGPCVAAPWRTSCLVTCFAVNLEGADGTAPRVRSMRKNVSSIVWA